MQQPKKRKTAGSVCIAVLFCMLAAECTALVMQLRSGPRGTVSAVQNVRETDPKVQYLMHARGSAAPERLTEALRGALDAAYSDYLAGNTLYAEAASAIRSLGTIGGDTLDAQAMEYLAAVEKTEAARQAYAAAQKAEQSGAAGEGL